MALSGGLPQDVVKTAAIGKAQKNILVRSMQIIKSL